MEVSAIRKRLKELAKNLWWSWNPEVAAIFRTLHPVLWRASQHNPIELLSRLSDADLAALADNEPMTSLIKYAFYRLNEYLHPVKSYGKENAGPLWRHPVAYFCAEFGLHEALPIYSGGLGVLAGDHLKSASDLDVPLVAVGLFYSHGYFNQEIQRDGWQSESYGSSKVDQLAISQVQDAAGAPLLIEVPCGEGRIHLRIWRLDVGRVKLFLLDSDIPQNREEDRVLTRFLYGGGQGMRIRQEIILGIGGVRALEAMGIEPGVYHLNEGHCAFVPLEVARQRTVERGEKLEIALANVKKRTVFTTHTPVPAGHDRFSSELIAQSLGWLIRELGLELQDFMGFGRVDPNDRGETFCMTVLALKCSRLRNGVSALHGEVSRRMWQDLWPAREESEVPIGHITNGVHVSSWLSPSMRRLYERHLGSDWTQHLGFKDFWHKITGINDVELWEEHQLQRYHLVDFIRRRAEQRERRLGTEEPRQQVADLLTKDALTIGFSRRFATYKRATLVLSDPERLDKLLNHPERPVQLVFAGKAHPRDEGGKRLIQQIIELSADERFRRRICFVENYDIAVGRHLVQGVDLWLNNPEKPREACGTSGQKVLLNGGLNCSVPDGWWAEAADGRNGFCIGSGNQHTDKDVQRERDAAALYAVLEDEVVPDFYERGKDGVPRRWVERIKHAIVTLAWRFNSDRMVKDYVEHMYLPAAGGTSCAL